MPAPGICNPSSSAGMRIPSVRTQAEAAAPLSLSLRADARRTPSCSLKGTAGGQWDAPPEYTRHRKRGDRDLHRTTCSGRQPPTEMVVKCGSRITERQGASAVRRTVARRHYGQDWAARNPVPRFPPANVPSRADIQSGWNGNNIIAGMGNFDMIKPNVSVGCRVAA